MRQAKNIPPRQPGYQVAASLPWLFLGLCLMVFPSFAQSPSPDEVTTTESEPNYTFQAERNLVLVRVVVRDSKGIPVGNLQKGDFLLYDNGKPQTITHFSVEKPEAPRPTAVEATAKEETEPDLARDAELKAASPHRYLALYFDDTRMKFGDIALVRKAAEEYLANDLTAGDRVGIFTASGQGDLDFTADRDALDQALLHLKPRPMIFEMRNECPEIADYQAYLMTSTSNPFAREIATQEVLYCRYQSDPQYLIRAQSDAQAEGYRQLEKYQNSSGNTLRGLDEVIRRLSFTPGQRSIVLVSPGFLTVGLEPRLDEIVTRALRKNIIVSTLDPLGLDATPPNGNAEERHMFIPGRPDLNGEKLQIKIEGERRSKDLLATLALDTGGLYFHNSNDLRKGFRLASGLPSVYYSLAFSPDKMKFDGQFHRLRVKLASAKSLTVEARQGYYAPRHSTKPEERAKEEIASAIYSNDEVSQIPIDVQTQFFKQSQLDATLAVLARVDLRYLQFRKQEGRNLNNLTVVTVLFDQNGNFVQGKEKRIDFRLLDSSLAKLSQSGLRMRTSFSVKPGTYMIREVVRDSEGSQLSGLTRTVEIPY